jgi:AraC family transcriptional regulator
VPGPRSARRLDLSIPLINADEPVVTALLTGLRSDLGRGVQPDNLYISHLVSLVLQRLAQFERRPDRRASDARASRYPLPAGTLCRIVEYVEAQLDTELRLEQLAHHANRHVDSFSRRFRASTGMSPYAYVLSRRVERARNLLSSTSQEVGDIGLQVGFSTPSHFSSTFRREVGMSPREYREVTLH